MRFRNPKLYVRIDCDIAGHGRFQDTEDLDAALGTWLRCLAHSHAQEQNGIVKLPWLRRAFHGKQFERVEELVRVGLLRERNDGDYEIHGYAPRNGTLRPDRSPTAEIAVTRDALERASCDGRARAPSEPSDPGHVGDAIPPIVTPRKVLH
jgi:hypothetical protein